MDETDAPRQGFGIEDWYLESNRFGHYLVFDGSEASAKRLVGAVEASGLGVRRWDESSRPADNGEFYDWFIRLGFDGSRQECEQRVRAILSPPSEHAMVNWDSGHRQAESDGGTFNVAELADAVAAASSTPVDLEEVKRYLWCFDPTSSGYLGWRYREVSTRPGHSGSDSVVGQLGTIASIAREEKQLLAQLNRQYGRFLENHPGLAQRALDAEFDKIDQDDWGGSADEALRRVRVSLAFLRRSVVLVFGRDDLTEQLLTMVRRLSRPTADHRLESAPRLRAAVSNLKRMTVLVEELFSGDNIYLGEVYANARSELAALERGDFDFLTGFEVDSGGQTESLVTDLPFVILPPGERIQSFVADLRNSGSYRGGVVDPGRLRVLEDLWEHFKDRRCALYRGAFQSSGNDNGYIVLGIADSTGDEDAVAISPWKGEHATFVVRKGCRANLTWQEVLAGTKEEAKLLGARRLVFTPRPDRGITEYEAMRQKVIALLSCRPSDFDKYELYFDYYDGCYRVRSKSEDYDLVSALTTTLERATSSRFFQRMRNMFGRS
jgi:hypothetical protein